MQNGVSTMLILAGSIIVALALITQANNIKVAVQDTGTFVTQTIEDATTDPADVPVDPDKTGALYYYNADGTATARTIDTRMDGNVNLPRYVTNGGKKYTVTTIREDAFKGSNIKSISIADKVTTIGKDAFRNTKLTSIDLPNSVTTVGSSAFADNSNLIKLSLSDGMTEIPTDMSANSGLTDINIPNSITVINSGAFYKTKLTSVYFPDNVTNQLQSGVILNSDNKPYTVSIGHDTHYRGDAFIGNATIVRR